MPVSPAPLSEVEHILDAQLPHPSALRSALLTVRGQVRRRTSWLLRRHLAMGLIQIGALHCGVHPPSYDECFGFSAPARSPVRDGARPTDACMT